MAQFVKQYNTPSGLAEIKITYQPGISAELDFDVVEDIELGYGYEDEDQLTFYPNTCKLTFDDFKKTNYDILKLSLGAYANTLPQNKMTYGGVEIKLNGAIKFKGYIDELTLSYDEDKLETSFEALDLTMQLRDMNVDRDKIIRTDNNERLPNNSLATLPVYWYGVFRQLWPDFNWRSYDATFINVPNLYGTFVKHDWIFKGDDVIIYHGQQTHLIKNRYWETLFDFEFGIFFNFDSTEMFGQNRPCRTWVDYLKLIALQFGAIIGIMDYGKVYFIKRFGTESSSATDITNKIIENEFSRSSHLPALRGTVVKNHWNGERVFEFGDVERTPNGDYSYENKVKNIETFIGSYRDGASRGTSIYARYDYKEPEYLLGVWDVWDPQMGGESNSGQIYELLGKWQRGNRITNKDMIECSLDGIDYDMVTIYKIVPWHFGPSPVLFRAMTMKKSILKNETKITGIEV